MIDDLICEIVVTNKIPSGTTFGERVDDGSAVFIPSGVSRACRLVPGQIVRAVLMANTVAPDRTPWVAVRCLVSDEDDSRTLEMAILADLADGCATAREVAQRTGRGEQAVRNRMRFMARKGVIVRDELYALTPADLLATDE